jgi:hypothetical protein
MLSHRSLDFLDLADAPCLVEKRLFRAVQPKSHEPAFSRVGLNPVAVGNVVWLLRTDINGGRAICRSDSGRRRFLAAAPWHFGQCRFRQL